MELKHGTKVTCEIDGTKITDAKISRNANGDFFICQNKCLSVVTAENKLGYKYSWLIYKGSVGDLEANEVTNLKIVYEPEDTLIGKELTKTIKGKKYKVVVKEEIK